GTMLLLAAATAAGAPQGGGQGSEPVLTAERIAADSAIRARRTLRIYQTLEMPYARTLNKTAATSRLATYYEHDLDKYPSNDFRNSLTGVVAGLTVTELTGTPGLYYA
ncbi:MAG: SusC/RagA family TonB-linked outer membrane protein, partial [Alistipes senegalensis]